MCIEKGSNNWKIMSGIINLADFTQLLVMSPGIIDFKICVPHFAWVNKKFHLGFTVKLIDAIIIQRACLFAIIMSKNRAFYQC